MLSRFRFSMLLSITALLILSSCGKKTNKEGRYIPKTAGFVILVNGESISAKLPWNEIKENDLFKKAYADSMMKDYMKAVLDNPENTGVDTKKNLIFFVQKDSSGGYVAFEGSIKDAAKFKAYNMNVGKGAIESEKDGIHFFSNAKMVSSYDKEKFVVVVDAPEMNMKSGYGNTNTESKRDLVSAAKGIYSLAENNSLAKDEKFSDLVGSKADVSFWVSSGNLMAGNAGMAALSMLNVGKLYEDSYMTGVTNFENGKISVDIKSYAGKELTDIFKKYSGATINTDMIKRIPAKDVAALFALSFKPEGLKEFIKLTGTEGFINIAVANFGFTFDDFIKANKGDILFSLSDIKKDSLGKPAFSALFAASVGNKNSFGKLIEAGNKLGKERMGNSTDNFLSYSVNDNFFSIGTEKSATDKFIGSANNSSLPILDKVSGSTSLFYLNIPMLMMGFSSDMSRDSLDNIAYQTTIKTWENIIATGGGFKNGSTNQHIEINMLDKNTNSLKQLNKYFGTMGNIQEQKKIKRDAWLNESMNDNIDYPVTVDSAVSIK